ncbi:MAG: hypothetical protein HOP07_07940 [Bacteriovoracaceae bacterium]|nr:hypothetical protein [Bacteriovoracaceae bacterium]
MEQSKQCTKCKTAKALADFGANSGKKDLLESWCRQCVSVHKKKTYRQKKKRLKTKQKFVSTVVGELSEESIRGFCEIFGAIYRDLSYKT